MWRYVPPHAPKFQYSPAPIGRALLALLMLILEKLLFQYSPAPIGRALVDQVDPPRQICVFQYSPAPIGRALP